MKKALLFILLLQFSISYAQDFSLTDQENRWGISNMFLCPPEDPDCNGIRLLGYRIFGDTIINDIPYVIIEIRSQSTNWSFYGYAREEEGIIYLYNESEGDSIFYDFTLEIGDSIDLSGIDFSEDENNNQLADVIEVSTQFIAGQNRKVITFDVFNGIFNEDEEPQYVQWIEGIGSSYDFGNPFQGNIDDVYILNCFNNGEEIFIITEENAIECESLLNLAEIQKITTSLIPNPITDQATLVINNFQNNTSISFYNLLGQRIIQKELTSSTTMINRSDFPSSGMYFYQIQSEGKVLDIQKIIAK